MNVSLLAEPAIATVAPERLVVINPLEYPQWDSLISTYPKRSFFHSAAWARVLHETYGHSPCYFCGFTGKKFQGMLPVMEVSSPVTSRRGVSLPFSDFCAPLSADEDVAPLFDAAVEYGKERKWKYLECRDEQWSANNAGVPSTVFYGHVVELGRGEDALSKQFDSAVRRGIRKAEHAGVQVDFSTSLETVRTFFKL